ncbi:NAD(P)H-dependent oxidoreductase [Streptomyces sp. NPDC002133]|uniref:FMN-dependent NADH-azoreductase n=1 Tax=Streptomyces sp. NPDC002133 TaxID=3154409 RepID=UPI00331933C9
MAHLLHIDSSAAPAGSVSREVAATFRTAWEQEHESGTVTHLDLALNPVPHLTSAGIAARAKTSADRSTEESAAAALQDRLVAQLRAADAYLFGVPMYNWTVPSTFKAWLDQIVIAGRTTVFGDEPETVKGRPATVIVSAGGGYGPGTPREGWDFATPYLEKVLTEALGLDVHTIQIELTMAHHSPAMAALRDISDLNRTNAHADAEKLARVLAQEFKH